VIQFNAVSSKALELQQAFVRSEAPTRSRRSDQSRFFFFLSSSVRPPVSVSVRCSAGACSDSDLLRLQCPFRCSGGSATWQLQGYSYHQPTSRARPDRCREPETATAEGRWHATSTWNGGLEGAQPRTRAVPPVGRGPRLTIHQNRSLFSPNPSCAEIGPVL
jgi:hypothetical protein